MKILWVATKAPWPAVDGGRLLMDLTLRALRDAGHEPTVVAPIRDREPDPAPEGIRLVAVPDPFRSKALDLLASWPRGRSMSLVRHRSRKTSRAIRRLLDQERFDVVHAEQLQALSLLDPRPGDPPGDPPVVLRTQNVESDLWRLSADVSVPWKASLLGREGRLLAREEGRAVASCAAACALTAEDAERLGKLAGRPVLPVIPPPFPERRPSAELPLAGNPAVVILVGSGWMPNLLGARRFLDDIWPTVAKRLPEAVLHVFGGGGFDLEELDELRVRLHPAPTDVREAFAPGSILAVPLRVASGIRMKILDAWSRGIPVIAASVAARGLGAEPGEHLLVADDADEFLQAVEQLSRPEVYETLVRAARRRLREHHDPARITARCVELYEEAGAKG